MKRGDISHWWSEIGLPDLRPALDGDTSADVCIVGAGYTGLWTAWYLKVLDPSLDVLVVEQRFAGFGASGRNGGWLTGGFAWNLARYAAHAGDEAVLNMVEAMGGTVDEVIRVAEAEGIGNTLVDFYSFDKLPVFMAATPEFVDKNPDTLVAYLKAWLECAKQFKDEHDKVSEVVYKFYTSKGYKMSKDTFAKALGRVEVDPGWPADLDPYMQHHAEVLIKAKKIKKAPDWNTAFRKDFMKKAMG